MSLASGEEGGCPFRHFDRDHLIRLLSLDRLDAEQAYHILNAVHNTDYTTACQRFMEAQHRYVRWTYCVGWLCLTSHRQQGHLETAPPFTDPCSINTLFRPGIEPRAVAWQSITLPLCHARSTTYCVMVNIGISRVLFVLFC